MKTRATYLAALCAIPAFAHADVSPIRIRVEQTTAVDRAKFQKTQKKSLKIFITNGTAQELSNLSVKD